MCICILCICVCICMYVSTYCVYNYYMCVCVSVEDTSNNVYCVKLPEAVMMDEPPSIVRSIEQKGPKDTWSSSISQSPQP